MSEGIAKLNLGDTKNDDDGGQELGGGEMMCTPRAQSDDVILCTPRGGQKSYNEVFKLTPDEVGPGAMKYSWQPGGGGLLAVVGTNHLLQIWNMADGGSVVKTIKLNNHGNTGAVSWIGWDYDGQIVAVMQPGVALYAWNWESSKQLVVIDQNSEFQQFSFLKWAANVKTLGLGGVNGKVMLFNSLTGKITPCKDGSHNAEIASGDWTTDNRLVLVSKQRVKVSEPFVNDGSDWKTATKIKFGKLVEKVPKKSVCESGKYDATPAILRTSLGTRSNQIAINLGCKVMVVVNCEGKMADEGFFIPMDYGEIVDFVWLSNGLLAIALSNGFILAVDTDLLMAEKKEKAEKLAKGAQVMKAGRVMTSYLQAICLSPDGDRLMGCGDNCTKIIECNATGKGIDIVVTHEVPVARELSIGCFLDHVQWAPKHLCVSSNDGHLHVMSFGV